MLASSFLDPVLGIDIHFEMVPTPAPVPLPIPNPFIGIVFDPIGLACGIALGAAIGAVVGAPFQGPVLYWTAFPATNTGTEAKHVPGHILFPPGTAWAPFPKTPKPVIHPGETPKPALPVKPENDAVVITGSKTVTVMGSNAVRLGDIALSCSEPLRLPSSVVLAVPKGAPILVGGPMSLDIMSAVMASLRTRFVSDSLHALISRLKPSRFRNLLHRGVCFFTGHPVDVASGKVMTEFVDVELPGPMPLKVERIYSSAFASRPGPLGHGWSLSLDQAVWRERGKVVLLAEDGREIEFDTFDFPRHRIEPGQQVHNPIERLTLHCGKAGTWTVVDRDGLTRHFAPVVGRDDGRAMIKSVVSRCGFHEIEFNYGTKGQARGRLQWVRDACGRNVQLTYDARGRVTGLFLPQPEDEDTYRHRAYEYDESGDLVRVVDALGHPWSFGYTNHLLTRETDRNGLSFYFQYDGLGEDAWCVRTWGDDGIYDHTLLYDKKQRVTYVTNSRGDTTRYHMNLVGQVVKIIDPLGGEVQYDYDPVTLAETLHVDELGRTTHYEYDPRGNMTAKVHPDGSTLELEHDESSRLVRATDPTGRETRWIYDTYGRTLERRRSNEPTVRYQYAGARVTRVTRSDGLELGLGYDGQGMLCELRSTEGTGFRWRHDALGRCVEEAEERGATTGYRFDANGHLIGSWEGTGDSHQLTRDPEGNVLRSLSSVRDVRCTYRGRGCMATRQEGSETLFFEHDGEECLTALHDGNGRRYSFELDPRGDIVLESGFGDRQRRYRRDAAGRALEIQRPGNLTTRLEYDQANRVTRVEYSDGTSERYEYRSDGQLMLASNDVTTIRFERDLVGRALREQQGSHWVSSSYDAGGNRVSLETSLRASQHFAYDALGRVVGLRHELATEPGSAWVSTIVRDLGGFEIERTLPGGARSCWERDPQGRPLHHQILDETRLTRDTRYQWGAGDRLQSVWSARRGLRWSYGHDARGILAWADYGDGTHELRLPDVIGNSFRRRDGTDRRYGDAGELLAIEDEHGESSRIYCPEGNLLERHDPNGDVWRYRWAGAGQLAEVERPDGEIVRFEYDALGRRVSKTFQGRRTRWLWDGHTPVHEWVEPAHEEPASDDPAVPTMGAAPPRPEPAAVVTWLFEPGRLSPAAKFVGHEQYSIVHDHLGAPVVMLDAEGHEVWEAELTIYGELRGLETRAGLDRDSCPFRWPGQYEDVETGLYYNRFRYYDCSVGAYISPDPLRLATRNRTPYSYADDPTIELDPFGLNKALWTLFDSSGDEVATGTMRPDPKAKSIPGRIGDSEQKILRHLESELGDSLNQSRLVIESQPTFIKVKGKTIPIQGIKPCDFCDPAMDAFAKKHDMTIEYKYRGKSVTYPKDKPSCP